ncbi:MAG TPA: hypothetical protein VFF65_12190 [Phycisphaerales bacterium]|nr:hypothetical protein [Phycisphaerales bacterium]
MSTSQRTFNQVKSILGKLDQRIDSLRASRTSPVPAALIGGDRLIGQAVTPPPAAPAFTPPSPAAPRSPFGRATPIRPTNG